MYISLIFALKARLQVLEFEFFKLSKGRTTTRINL